MAKKCARCGTKLPRWWLPDICDECDEELVEIIREAEREAKEKREDGAERDEG